MSTIRINTPCTEFGRTFTLGQVVVDLSELEATAMDASGLAKFLQLTATALPNAGVVPITSVQFANPAAYGFNVKSDRFYEFNGGRYHWGGSGFVAGALSATQLTQAAALVSTPGNVANLLAPGLLSGVIYDAGNRAVQWTIDGVTYSANYSSSGITVAGTDGKVTNISVDPAQRITAVAPA